jgi:guanosine-3',5'-bis(diphosphate) 3'-pyrophosphohydrolase
MHPDRETQRLTVDTCELAQLLEALQFAAHKHRAQRRKDVDASPYINHPLEVATILATSGGVEDIPTLLAAILHDTIEDTETSPEELEERFGSEVRSLVLEVTDDKRLPKEDRKRLQIEHASRLSPKAKLIKLGDKIANVHDVTDTPPATWSLARRRDYLDWTEQVVRGCRGVNPALERRYDEALQSGRQALEASESG